MTPELEKECKKYVLTHMEEFCDMNSIQDIETIAFWKGIDNFGNDFSIIYTNWSWEAYSYERNVLPKLEK